MDMSVYLMHRIIIYIKFRRKTYVAINKYGGLQKLTMKSGGDMDM